MSNIKVFENDLDIDLSQENNKFGLWGWSCVGGPASLFN